MSAPHDAHVITKTRSHGDRDGEMVHYLCGPQRATRAEAELDLERYLGTDAASTEALSDRVTEAAGFLCGLTFPDGSQAEGVHRRVLDLVRSIVPATDLRAQLATLRGAAKTMLSVIDQPAPKGTDRESRTALLVWGAKLGAEANRLRAALAPDAGRREAEVLLAADRVRGLVGAELDDLDALTAGHGLDLEFKAKLKGLVAAVDALRGGEGEG